MCIYMYSIMRLKKEARQFKKIFFEFKIWGSPTCIKCVADKIGILDGWVIHWLGDAAASMWKTCQHKPYIVVEILQHKSSIYPEHLNCPITH